MTDSVHRALSRRKAPQSTSKRSGQKKKKKKLWYNDYFWIEINKIYQTQNSRVVTSHWFRNIGRDHLLNTTHPTRTPINPTEAHVRASLHSRSHTKSPDITVEIRELDGGSKRLIWDFWSTISVGGESNTNAVGMESTGSTTSTWATPPKKSAMRVLSKGRLNRSLRTPWWELIFVTSIESN